MVTPPLDFYFDFSSPYGYLAATAIDAISARHGRSVEWRPFLLGAAFKESGARPLTEIPLKGDYVRHDLPRFARRLGVPFTLPQPFPFLSINACRAFYWLRDRDGDLARRFAKAVFAAAFGEGRDVSGSASVCQIAAALGVSAEETRTALLSPAVKERLRAEVDAAVKHGMFGSPLIIVDGERFWGADRLEQVDAWLTMPW